MFRKRLRDCKAKVASENHNKGGTIFDEIKRKSVKFEIL